MFRSLLSRRPHRACGLDLPLDEFLHGEYHAGGRGCVRVVHRLHAAPQTESGEGALNPFAEGDAGVSEGDAEVCTWLRGSRRVCERGQGWC